MSPIVGEVILVALVIVLAGSLLYFLSASPNQQSEIELPLGTSVQRTTGGNWTLMVVRGSTNPVDARIMVKNPTTGAATFSDRVSAPSWYFIFYDNNRNALLDAGDGILLNQTAGVVEEGFELEILKSDSTLSGPLKLPP